MNRPAEIMPQKKKRQPGRKSESREQQAEQSAIHGAHATRDFLARFPATSPRCFLATAAALVLLLAVACSKPADEEPEKPEIVDIAAPADVALSFDDDVQAKRTNEGLAGVLPGGFPEDLPLFDPASIVDTSETDDGRMAVVLQHPVSLQVVESFFDRELPLAGWQSEGGSSYQNSEGRKVEISVEAMGGVTRARIVF
jgi:hypothetical protein